MARRDQFWQGTLVGLIVGLVGGVLLAPKSGKETRAALKRRTKQLAGDASERVNRLSTELNVKVEKLREAAQDLGEEARAESQGLIARAEVLKQDLRSSTKSLADSGRMAKDATMGNVRRLIDEGSTLMNELESVTKRLVTSAKTKLGNNHEPKGEAVQRVEELERNGHEES
jgi:gas vesicle protein